MDRVARRRLILYWTPLLAWMAAIFTLSSLTASTIEQAASPVQAFPLSIRSEVAHMVEFGVLAVLAHRLLASYRVVAAPLWAAVLSFAAAYGATDELHQALVPGRDPSWLDLAYDSAGGFLGLLAAEATAVARRRLRRPSN